MTAEFAPAATVEPPANWRANSVTLPELGRDELPAHYPGDVWPVSVRKDARSPDLQRAVVDALGDGPLTTDAIARLLDIDNQRAARILVLLQRAGVVKGERKRRNALMTWTWTGKPYRRGDLVGRPDTAMAAIEDLLRARGAMRCCDIARALKTTLGCASSTLSQMVRSGRAERVKRGWYALPAKGVAA